MATRENIKDTVKMLAGKIKKGTMFKIVKPLRMTSGCPPLFINQYSPLIYEPLTQEELPYTSFVVDMNIDVEQSRCCIIDINNRVIGLLSAYLDDAVIIYEEGQEGKPQYINLNSEIPS